MTCPLPDSLAYDHHNNRIYMMHCVSPTERIPLFCGWWQVSSSRHTYMYYTRNE